MNTISAVITAMRAKGMSDTDILDVVQTVAEAQEAAPVIIRDEAAERRREQDRNRKAQMRNNLRKSAEVCGHTPLSPLSPPHTPPKNPPIIPHSDTDVSAQAPADFRSDLFRRGVSDVMAITGLPAPRARTLIGSWLKLAKDEAIHVLRAIDDATEAKPADPVPWIRRAIEAQMRTRDPPKRVWGSV